MQKQRAAADWELGKWVQTQATDSRGTFQLTDNHTRDRGSTVRRLSAVSLRYLPSGRDGHACCITPPVINRLSRTIRVRSQRCKAAAQTRTSRLVATSLPLRRVAINHHPQQVTAELLVELGKMPLPDAAKAQQGNRINGAYLKTLYSAWWTSNAQKDYYTIRHT